MVTIGYSEFASLFPLDDRGEVAPNLALRPDGVYVKEPDELMERVGGAGDTAELTRHPTGNIRAPALAFPCTVDELRKFVTFYEISGYPDAFEFMKVLERRAFEQASLDASAEGHAFWPIVAGHAALKVKLRRALETARDDVRKLVLREVLEELEKLAPGPCEDDVAAATIETRSAHTPLRPDQRGNWLRIIRALLAKAKVEGLEERKAVSAICNQIESLGFDGPDDDTVRSVLKEARAARPE